MLAITGTTGHLGRAVLQFLLPHLPATELVAIVRDPAKVAGLQAAGVQVRQGDYDDPASLIKALQGVDKLLLVSSSELEFEPKLRQHRHVIDVARQAGVGHVVYTSIFRPAADSHFSANRAHAATEKYLRESGLTYTMLRNTLYLDLVPMFVGEGAVESGHIYFAAGEGQVSFALREELAEATARVLASAGHENQTYDLAPAPPYSFRDIAAALGEVTGRPVQYVPLTTEQMTAGMREHQVPEPVVNLTAEIAQAMAANELNGSSPDFARLLGRQPTDLKTYLQAVYRK